MKTNRWPAGFVRLGILLPHPNSSTVASLCEIAGGKQADLMNFEHALCSNGPDYVEVQYLMKGFGYSVYKEGFDVVFHYNVGEERGDEEMGKESFSHCACVLTRTA